MTSGKLHPLLIAGLLMTYSIAVTLEAHGQSPKRRLLSSPKQPSRTDVRLKRGLASGRIASFTSLALGNLISNVRTVTTPIGTSTEPNTVRAFEDPRWRLNWFLFQRTFPADTFPSKARFFAYDNALQLPEPTPEADASPSTQRWEAIGPAPITPRFPSMGVTSGRINAIAVSPVDPQTVLVGGATGGIWRSIDGGLNFVPVSDDQVDLAVGSIAFAPSNPSIVYAGMGDVAGGYMGTGVLKSLDAGKTWKRISGDSLPVPSTIANIVVEPSDPDRVYLTQYSYRAATGQGEIYASGFFISTDGGKTWRKTLTGQPRDLAHHPTNSQTLFLAMATTFAEGPPSAGLYKSVNGGMTWSPLFLPSYHTATDIRVAIAPSEPDTIYVFTGLITRDEAEVSIHVSHNGGSSWTNLGSSGFDTGDFGYNTIIAVDPTYAKTVYVGTHDLYKSTDGCASWRNLTKNWSELGGAYDFSPFQATTHTDQHAIAFAGGNSGTIFIGNDGGISQSTDGGQTFRSLNSSLSLTQFNSITQHPADPGKSCGGTQDNGALIRNSIGSWEEFFAGDSGRCLIDPTNPGVFYVSYIFGRVYKFHNQGASSDGLIASEGTFDEPTRTPRIAFYPPFVINPSNGVLYFGTWRVHTSANQGNDWRPPASDQDLTRGETEFGADVLSAIGIAPSDATVIYTGSAQGRVMVTKNGGNSWTDKTAGLPRRFITTVVVDRQDANKAYVTLSGFGSGHIYQTTNGGAEWKDISKQLPNIPVNALLVDPLDSATLYAGTDVGVLRSTDDGTTWFRFRKGLPPVIVTGFSAQPGGAIQVATYGRGVYELIR